MNLNISIAAHGCFCINSVLCNQDRKIFFAVMATATRVKSKLRNDELKDAYQGWLKDLYDEKPLKKRGTKRRSRQAQRMLHVQQPTAASALKDVVLNKGKLPVISLRCTPEDKQNLQDSQRRRHQTLVAEANYSAFQYALHPSWRPGIAFFQQLVRQLLPKSTSEAGNEGVVSLEVGSFPVQVAPILLRVPLYRQGGKQLSVALFYCLEQNQQMIETGMGMTSFVLHCRVYLQATTWREHRNFLLDTVSNASAEICAVRKCAENFESRNNELQLLKSRQDMEKTMDELWVDDYDTDLLAIQKYIPFKGATNTFTSTPNTPSIERKAWIARCASRKREKNSSTVWIISGGDNSDSSSTITSSSSTDCQIVKCTIDQAWLEPRLLASMCTGPLEKALRIRFSELVVDLLQDTSGAWWLLQVKAFTLASLRPVSAVSVSTSLSKQSPSSLSRTKSAPTCFDVGIATSQWKKWRCAGRFCVTKGKNPSAKQQLGDDEKEPCGYLTKKMMRSCEFYDDFVRHQDMSLAGGFTDFHSALGFHLQHRLSKRDRSQLYEPQPLCSTCVKKYHLLRQQWIETVDPPKSSTESNIGGHRKKNVYVKTSSEGHSAPHKLPALYALPAPLKTSSSAPVIPSSSHSNSVNSASTQPNYLDDMAAMEKMLAEHEPSSLLSATKTEPPSSENQKRTVLNPLITKPGSDDIFPKWDGATRIEEMWQNLTFKPLDNQLMGKNHGYNSISLKQELAKAFENDENNSQTKHNEDHQREEMNAVHKIHVQHCRQVFEDEMYREDLVKIAYNVLHSGKATVCFVVPPPSNPERKQTDDEVAEMALRSLYIDVKQSIADDSSQTSLSSWPLRPTVYREASGCISVKLGPR